MQARLEAAGARAALEGALVERAELEARRSAEAAAAARGPSRHESEAVAAAATVSLRHEVELRVAAEAARDSANATCDALRRALGLTGFYPKSVPLRAPLLVERFAFSCHLLGISHIQLVFKNPTVGIKAHCSVKNTNRLSTSLRPPPVSAGLSWRASAGSSRSPRSPPAPRPRIGARCRSGSRPLWRRTGRRRRSWRSR